MRVMHLLSLRLTIANYEPTNWLIERPIRNFKRQMNEQMALNDEPTFKQFIK